MEIILPKILQWTYQSINQSVHKCVHSYERFVAA